MKQSTLGDIRDKAIMEEGRYQIMVDNDWYNNNYFTSQRAARTERSRLAKVRGVPSIYFGIWDRIKKTCV